ncbi:inhibitor of growth protein 4-like isoform X1 [Choristoneura fumiferana]|uniref:inhibitor of growth protein 4-like isoform X1 n=2 Tax=Choristoneura fumiferana TaxID=7141 RepID=UPI003D15DA12
MDYRLLLEHLYWRHGTESIACNKCGLRRWEFAEHMCNVLPIYQIYDIEVDEAIDLKVRESPYCYCGKDLDAHMIGCDEPQCRLQWYHFKCVGIEVPPKGDWFCPECSKTRKKKK